MIVLVFIVFIENNIVSTSELLCTMLLPSYININNVLACAHIISPTFREIYLFTKNPPNDLSPHLTIGNG